MFLRSYKRQAKKLLDKKVEEATEAEDPRNYTMLVASMLRDVSADHEVMIPVLNNLKGILNGEAPVVRGRSSTVRSPTPVVSIS